MSIRLSTSTNIYFNRPDGSKACILDSMRYCAAAGYRVMDLNFYDCATFQLPFVQESGWQAWLHEIVDLTQALGLIWGQAHAPFYNFCNPSDPKACWMDPLVYRSIDCCQTLGIPWLVIHAGTDFSSVTPLRDSFHKNRTYFLPILDYATRRGVGIAFENLWDLNIAPLRRYTTGLEELLTLTDSFSDAKVGICWDTDHAHLMGQDQAESLRLIGNRLKTTHICDCINATADHMLPYSGSIDWLPILQALGEIGYTGDFTYEIHRYSSTLPDQMIANALKYSVFVGETMIKCIAQQ